MVNLTQTHWAFDFFWFWFTVHSASTVLSTWYCDRGDELSGPITFNKGKVRVARHILTIYWILLSLNSIFKQYCCVAVEQPMKIRFDYVLVAKLLFSTGEVIPRTYSTFFF